MRYRLYYAVGSAAMGVRVLLEELDADYALRHVSIEMDDPREANHLALNPNGWVPVLAWEDGAMYEAAAIFIYLVDLHPKAGLGPALDDPKRPLFLQTLTYMSNTIQTAFQQYYYPFRFAADDAGLAGAEKRGVSRLREVWQVLDAQIGDQPWVLGDRFSAADIYLYMLTTWLAPEDGHPTLEALPNVARVVAGTVKRDNVKLVYGL